MLRLFRFLPRRTNPVKIRKYNTNFELNLEIEKYKSENIKLSVLLVKSYMHDRMSESEQAYIRIQIDILKNKLFEIIEFLSEAKNILVDNWLLEILDANNINTNNINNLVTKIDNKLEKLKSLDYCDMRLLTQIHMDPELFEIFSELSKYNIRFFY